MAAQRTEKEDTDFSIVPERTEKPLSLPPAAASSSAVSPTGRFTSARSASVEPPARPPIRSSQVTDGISSEKREVSRCSSCGRKVGLTGFRCRCGDLFCSEHRYSDRHECGYDYKTAGREAITRANPLVKAAKIIRI